jgi:hypothetical protein
LRASRKWKAIGYLFLFLGYLLYWSIGKIGEMETKHYPISDSSEVRVSVSRIIPNLNSFLKLVATVLMLSMMLTAVAWIRFARKLTALNGQQKLLSDSRRPVLYLRSFQRDLEAAEAEIVTEGDNYSTPQDESFRGWEVISTEEEQIAAVLGMVGPVIAIGNPADVLPDLGAARIYLKNSSDWREIVTTLIARSSLVALHIGTTEGVMWELEQVLRNTPLKRLLLLISLSEKDYTIVKERIEAVLGPVLYPYRGRKVYGALRGCIYFRPSITNESSMVGEFLPMRRSILYPYSFRPLVPVLKKTLRPLFRELRRSRLMPESTTNDDIIRALKPKIAVRTVNENLLRKPPVAIYPFVGSLLSLFVPGVGYLLQGRLRMALGSFFAGMGLLLSLALMATKVPAYLVGIGVLLYLIWCVRQATDVYISIAGTSAQTRGLLEVLRLGAKQGDDVRLIGLAFLAMPIFVDAPALFSVVLCSDILGGLQQLYFLVLGYGLFMLRPWSLFFCIGLAAIHLVNILLSHQCYTNPNHIVIMGVLLVLSCGYVFARRGRLTEKGKR